MIPEEWQNYAHPKSPHNPPHESPHDSTDRAGRGKDIITVYIVLFVLRKMRTHLGLEATLEYAESYMKKMESQNLNLRNLVFKELAQIDVQRMYKDAIDS